MVPTEEKLTCVKDKRIVLISHDLSQTGGPLLLVETAVKLRRAGANVQLVTLAEDAHKGNLAARNNISLLPVADSFKQSAQADVVIANTAATSSWVNAYLEEHPERGHSLIWWIHEINADFYAKRMGSLNRVAMALFDSNASLKKWADTGLSFPPIARVIHPSVDDAFVQQAAGSRFVYPKSGMLKKLPNNPGACTRDEIRKKLGIRPDDFVLTLIGTYDPLKGQDLLVSTVRRLLSEDPRLPIKVILVGFHGLKQKVWFITKQQVWFTKGLNQAARQVLDRRRAVTIVHDVTPYYAASDAFVMNSQEPGENFGRVTIEAMTFRLPVLGTDAGGTPEIIEKGVTGLLHPVGIDGQDQLAENVLTLVRNREKANSMGEAGYRRVQEKFTSARFLAELDFLLEMILGKGGKISFN
jgi:glycosyltransferase involved in cell wall biosynthesis